MSPSVFSSHSLPTQYQPSSLISHIKDTFGFWWPSRAQPFGSFINLRKSRASANVTYHRGQAEEGSRGRRLFHKDREYRSLLLFRTARIRPIQIARCQSAHWLHLSPIPAPERNGCRAGLLSRLNRPGGPREGVREGRKWLVESLDLMTLPHQLKHRKLIFVQWVRSLRSDPSAFWAMCLSVFRSFWSDRFKRLHAAKPRRINFPARSESVGGA